MALAYDLRMRRRIIDPKERVAARSALELLMLRKACPVVESGNFASAWVSVILSRRLCQPRLIAPPRSNSRAASCASHAGCTGHPWIVVCADCTRSLRALLSDADQWP